MIGKKTVQILRSVGYYSPAMLSKRLNTKKIFKQNMNAYNNVWKIKKKKQKQSGTVTKLLDPTHTDKNIESLLHHRDEYWKILLCKYPYVLFKLWIMTSVT